jgi:DNA modification methylase
MTTSHSLFADEPKPSGPVECLGQTFPSDAARREHYLAILREKLKDPVFREIEGFPIGTDEDILALSDPPYYTACPNPFIEDFIKHYGKPYDPSVAYNKEPFAADVSEGKNDPIYNAHSYHTKVPHKAIMRYILHYTQPGDIVFDGFSGTGMTGVAAQLCGNRTVVESIGYRVEADGSILEHTHEGDRSVWLQFSKLGERRSVLNDLSPAATFIAYNYNKSADLSEFESEAQKVITQLESECSWMYKTLHTDGETNGRINYTVWSDVFVCSNCAGEVIFWDVALDRSTGRVRDEFLCPHCQAKLTKKSIERAKTSNFSQSLGKIVEQAKQYPVLINYSIGTGRLEKRPDGADLALIRKITETECVDFYPETRIDKDIDLWYERDYTSLGVFSLDSFFTSRNLRALAALRRIAVASADMSRPLLFALTGILQIASRMSSFRYDSRNPNNTAGGILKGALYIPSLSKEARITDLLQRKISGLIAAWRKPRKGSGVLISTQSSTTSALPNASADYLFFDPPFGSNIIYSDLSLPWEEWLRISTNTKREAVIHRRKKNSPTTIDGYRELMSASFLEAFRILKPGRWMTVEFSNTQASVWNAIQIALQDAGFVVANVSALDKQQGSFKAVTTTTAVKQDLVISAYKPNGGLEERFAKAGGSEDSAWDFVRTHLKYLPTVKVKNSELEFVAERDPRIIFDRLVAWFVRHSFPVPLSSQEFQAGLSQRFAERDGMAFLPEQVSEYDKKRMQTAKAPQMELFIADERSAIDWLSDFLKKKPSTYQEIHPEFIKQLGAGWKKHEAKPELSYLLESNFLCYDPKDKDGIEVPSQIHSYLSTNWQEFRNLEKSDPRLKAKATDRWFVPDPNRARQMEMFRDKALLKEFDAYRSFTGRRLKTFRLEAMRAGFRAAWVNKDYPTIIDIAGKLPDEALQEDEKLLTLYDLALTRMEMR